MKDVWPLYRELHTWARYELAKKYKQPVPDYIPADWLPNRWGQDWTSLVNVEGSASMQDLVGGHPITGHIDTVGKIIDITNSESWKIIRISVDKSHRNLIVSKGSICIDGVSLTISNIGTVEESWFEVSLIPATLSHTTLDSLVVANLVNIEFDQIGKYIAQNMQMQNDK